MKLFVDGVLGFCCCGFVVVCLFAFCCLFVGFFVSFLVCFLFFVFVGFFVVGFFVVVIFLLPPPTHTHTHTPTVDGRERTAVYIGWVVPYSHLIFGAICGSLVGHPLVVRWVVGSTSHDGPLYKPILVPTSAPLINKDYSCLWNGAYKRSLAANREQ